MTSTDTDKAAQATLYDRLLDAIPAAVFTTDTRGAITFQNRAAIDLLGRRPTLAGDAWYGTWRLLNAEGSPLPREDYPTAAVLRDGHAVLGAEAVLERRNGSRVWVLFHSTPLRNGDGALSGSANVLVDISQRKRTEAENQRATEDMRHQAEDLKTLLNVAPIAVAVAHDPLANEITVNAAGAQMLGIQLGENTSKSGPGGACLPFKVLSNGMEVAPEALPIQRAAREDIELAALEYEVMRADGSRVSLLEYASPLHDEAGNVRGALGIFVDMTDRKKADEANLRLRALIESAEIAIISCDHGGKIESWNPAAERMLGYTPEEAIGLHISMLSPPDRLAEQAEALARVLRGERLETFETVRKRKDETLVDVSLALSQVKTGENHFLGFAVMLRDITARKVAEAALRGSEARFRTLNSLSPVGIYLTNPRGDFVMVNERWREYAGLSVEEARGRGWLDAVHPDDRDHVDHEWYEAARRGEEYSGEYRFRKPDGTAVWLRSIARAMPADDGGVGGYVGTITDITRLKEAEEIKDQFLSLISHELRTPLATIYGSSRLLHDRFETISSEDRRDLVDDLVTESDRLQRIIENLLLMTRLDAGKVELEPVNLPRLIERSIAAFKNRHPNRAVNVSAGGDVSPVQANDMYVELVLENLLSNAHKYSQPEAPIELKVEPVQDGVEVRVMDQGIGIAVDDMDKLFAPFFRSRQARGVASGTGIGLAVCKRVIDAQGGTIWARPRTPQGAEFGFRLRSIDMDVIESGWDA